MRTAYQPVRVPILPALGLVILLFLPALSADRLRAQGQRERLTPVTPLEGTLERIKVHGASLEGALTGDSPERDVSVYLPPSYDEEASRRYPVVYMLHGFTDDDDHWFGWVEHFVNVPAAMERALSNGTVGEMILVMPNAYNVYQGTMYSSSVTTGDWESYVAEDLPSYIDGHYRTIPDRASRGLAGHSLGGYGTIRIGMKRPDVFSSIYVMSPCCMPANISPDGAAAERAEAIREVGDLRGADFRTRAMFASAAAWSPNPHKPPLFLDLPVEDGELRPDIVARWVANAPLAMIPQYIPNLRKLHAIALESGAQDGSITGATRALDEILTEYGIEHTSEIYDPGTHISRVDERVELSVLPFFSRNLRNVANQLPERPLPKR